MTAAQRRAAALDMRAEGKSYTQTAVLLGTTRSAVAGALARADGRYGKPPKKPRPKHYKDWWNEERLTEPWTVWAARRRAARMRDKAMTNA